MNLAIIGAGKWGKNLLREFNKIAEIYYVCHTGNTETDRWLKENYPTAAITHHYQEILKDKKVPAVVIATPIKTHFKIASDCLKSGKHVFLEKPMTDNLEQAKKLVAIAKKNKLILFVGHIFIYHAILKKIKALTKKDPIQSTAFYWGKWGHFTEDIFWNLACHEISIAIDLMGQPQKISLINKTKAITEGDLVSLKLEFSNKKTATMNINRLSPEKRKTVTLLTKNNLLVWNKDHLYRLDKKNQTLKLIYQSKIAPLVTECRAFIENIKTKKEPITNGEFGLSVVKILNQL